MNDLRERRLALGLTLEELAAETRIPLAVLEAFDEGRIDDVPAGPRRDGSIRLLRQRLGLDPDAAEDEPAPLPTPSRVPLWVVRTLAIGSSLAMLLAIGWQVHQVGLPNALLSARSEREVPVAAGDTDALPIRDDDVKIHALARGPIRVIVDGKVALERKLDVGEDASFGGKRVEVDVAAASDVRIVWRGEPVSPQGRQDRSRKLVFVDDASPE